MLLVHYFMSSYYWFCKLFLYEYYIFLYALLINHWSKSCYSRTLYFTFLLIFVGVLLHCWLIIEFQLGRAFVMSFSNIILYFLVNFCESIDALLVNHWSMSCYSSLVELLKWDSVTFNFTLLPGQNSQHFRRGGDMGTPSTTSAQLSGPLQGSKFFPPDFNLDTFKGEPFFLHFFLIFASVSASLPKEAAALF